MHFTDLCMYLSHCKTKAIVALILIHSHFKTATTDNKRNN